jgi:hypothetical protein
MCENCDPIESNTGVVVYSGPTLVICNGNTITNGETLTSVITKIDNCIGVLQNQLDFTGLVENSPCIELTRTSLQTVLQSIINTESQFCTRLQTLDTQITNLQNQINNLNLSKSVTVTSCDSTRVTLTETSNSKTFKLQGLVPPNTILPYFGPTSDFHTSGLGRADTNMAGWAIANGQNGTINALNKFIKYSSSSDLTVLGNDEIELNKDNIPEIEFQVNANFNLSGTTNEAGRHTHKIRHAYNEGPLSNCPDFFQNSGDDPCCRNGSGIDPGTDCGGAQYGTIGYSGLHSHTFNAEAQGNFSSKLGCATPEKININPKHITAIPIQWVGFC